MRGLPNGDHTRRRPTHPPRRPALTSHDHAAGRSLIVTPAVVRERRAVSSSGSSRSAIAERTTRTSQCTDRESGRRLNRGTPCELRPESDELLVRSKKPSLSEPVGYQVERWAAVADGNDVDIAVVLAFVLLASFVAALGAEAQGVVLIAAIFWLLIGVPWVLVVALSATPCGLSGRGVLSAGSECSVQAIRF